MTIRKIEFWCVVSFVFEGVGGVGGEDNNQEKQEKSQESFYFDNFINYFL